MKCIYSIFCAFFLLIASTTNAQDFSEIMREVNGIQQAYKTTGYLSYNVDYLYSKSSDPGIYMDSLRGNCKIHDSSSCGSIGTIDFLQNPVTSIAVYKHDKLITLNTPVKQENKIMPLAGWDSVFIALNIDTAIITDKDNVHTIEFKFSPAANYKNIVVQYDPQTYLLEKLVITAIQPPVDILPGQQQPDDNIVTIMFSNYSVAAFDDNVFSEKKYLQLQGEQKSATSPYSNFRLVDLRKPVNSK